MEEEGTLNLFWPRRAPNPPPREVVSPVLRLSIRREGKRGREKGERGRKEEKGRKRREVDGGNKARA